MLHRYGMDGDLRPRDGLGRVCGGRDARRNREFGQVSRVDALGVDVGAQCRVAKEEDDREARAVGSQEACHRSREGTSAKNDNLRAFREDSERSRSF